MQNTNKPTSSADININAAQQGVAEEQQTEIEFKTVKELIEVLRGCPQDYAIGAGSLDTGAGSVKYVDIDGVAKTVTIWNTNREEIEEFYAEHSSEPYAQAAQTHSERHKQAANQQHCTVCGENVGNDNLYWETPDLPYACSLVCESCMPKDPEGTNGGSWCDEESDAERNV